MPYNWTQYDNAVHSDGSMMMILLLVVRLLYSAHLQLCGRCFTSLFPCYWNLSVPVPTQLPGEHTALLPSWSWKLFKHTSNHCPIRFPSTPGWRKCTYRCSAFSWDIKTLWYNNGMPYAVMVQWFIMPCPTQWWSNKAVSAASGRILCMYMFLKLDSLIQLQTCSQPLYATE